MATATDQPATTRLTIDDYLARPDKGRLTELVEGRIIEVPPPGPRHGLICCQLAWILGSHVLPSGLGRVMTNDSGVITRRDPDSVRGADVVYYPAAKLPPLDDEAGWQGYFAFAPDLVAEVRSPSDRWSDLLATASEYLAAGVVVVILLDPASDSATVLRGDAAPVTLGPDEDLTVPDLLPEFRVRVGAIFA